jgi:starvation-inducible DNA-binding protein
MYQMKNELPLSTRTSAVQLLNARLADALDLMLQAKQARWNVRGSGGLALRRTFDETARRIEQFANQIAERAAALGGIAEGTARVTAARSTLADYPLELMPVREHVDALSGALARFGKLARTAIGEASGLGDADTADLFTELSRGVYQTLCTFQTQFDDGARFS